MYPHEHDESERAAGRKTNDVPRDGTGGGGCEPSPPANLRALAQASNRGLLDQQLPDRLKQGPEQLGDLVDIHSVVDEQRQGQTYSPKGRKGNKFRPLLAPQHRWEIGNPKRRKDQDDDPGQRFTYFRSCSGRKMVGLPVSPVRRTSTSTVMWTGSRRK